MRAVIQRVTEAAVSIAGEECGRIGSGFVILLGIGAEDGPEQVERLWSKIYKMRIFSDGTHHTGAGLADVDGNVLVVSQFTLYANCKKGNRPSFTEAKGPEESERLYQAFCTRAREDLPGLQTGVFGADMQVSLVNDGPFTIVLDTASL